MTTRTRLEPKDRKKQILAAALLEADRVGFAHVTRDGIAKAAGVSAGVVNQRFGTMADLRRDIMRAAVRAAADGKHLRIIADGLAASNPYARRAPPEIKDQALQLLK